MSTSTPSFVGPYRLLNPVNTGQTSRIWQAMHDGKQEIFGLKMLLDKFSRDREQIGLLKWEYGVGAKLEHPNIIRLLEFGVDRGMYFLAMEWFPAPNLKVRIRQGVESYGWMVPKVVVAATDALTHFSNGGWVHRDIKPDNFLVDDEGNVKLIDFALAKRKQTGLMKLLPQGSKIQGTRSYMSPEQIRNQALDERADMYSFGCMLFELLAGKPPFTGANTAELLNRHLKSAPPHLEVSNKNVTPEFAEIVKRCMAKKPAQRFKSMQELLALTRGTNVFRRPMKRPEG